MTPKYETIAYLLWWHGKKCEWITTVEELSVAVGQSVVTVRKILREKGWTKRIKSATPPPADDPHVKYLFKSVRNES